MDAMWIEIADASPGSEPSLVQRVPFGAAAALEEEMSVDVNERTRTRQRRGRRHQRCVSSTSWTSAELAACSMSISVCSSCAIAG